MLSLFGLGIGWRFIGIAILVTSIASAGGSAYVTHRLCKATEYKQRIENLELQLEAASSATTGDQKQVIKDVSEEQALRDRIKGLEQEIADRNCLSDAESDSMRQRLWPK